MYLGSCIAMIKRPKINGVGEHWGILFPDRTVAHLTFENGIETISFDQFSMGKSVKIVRKESLIMYPEIMSRLNSEIKRPSKYDLVTNNCETFANRIMGYKPESKQVQSALLLIISSMFLFSIR